MQTPRENELLTFLIGKQWIGLDINQVLEVLVKQPCTVMPLASKSVMGLINLRGRVVTEIDVRTVIGLPSTTGSASHRVLIVETDNSEAAGLVVDAVGEVVAINHEHVEQTPNSLPKTWKKFSCGIIQQKDRALLLMNVEKFIALTLEQQDNETDDTGNIGPEAFMNSPG